jgi:hypothetical protein
LLLPSPRFIGGFSGFPALDGTNAQKAEDHLILFTTSPIPHNELRAGRWIAVLRFVSLWCVNRAVQSGENPDRFSSSALSTLHRSN